MALIFYSIPEIFVIKVEAVQTFLLPNYREGPKFRELIFKITPISDHSFTAISTGISEIVC